MSWGGLPAGERAEALGGGQGDTGAAAARAADGCRCGSGECGCHPGPVQRPSPEYCLGRNPQGIVPGLADRCQPCMTAVFYLKAHFSPSVRGHSLLLSQWLFVCDCHTVAPWWSPQHWSSTTWIHCRQQYWGRVAAPVLLTCKPAAIGNIGMRSKEPGYRYVLAAWLSHERHVS